ncbi:unnamed protein product [Soboliphyme baturini]|uniref:Uncharacterized protein n=1 Tax=Soboliphyme baturini TaxID=241478 RepID=A0A183IMK5_9BILA|nr:unnamed protein product [Soboliphyme baturini]
MEKRARPIAQEGEVAATESGLFPCAAVLSCTTAYYMCENGDDDKHAVRQRAVSNSQRRILEGTHISEKTRQRRHLEFRVQPS